MDEGLSIPGTRVEGCSRRSLQKLLAGELDAAEASRVRGHAKGCSRCGSALAALEREASDFASQMPFEAFEASVQARRRPRARWARTAGVALAAGLAALVLLAGPLATRLEDERNAGNRIKGGATLELFVAGAGAAPRLAQQGEKLAAGERIRLGYQAAGTRYLLVLSIDESAEVSALYPPSGRSLAAEQGPGTHLLPDSLELTGTGLERVIAIFSDKPIEVSRAAEAARSALTRAGSLDRMGPLPLDAEQSAVVVRKP